MDKQMIGETERLLTEHARRYPLQHPEDAVKWLYQGVFGPGHLLTDEETFARRLLEEEESTAGDGEAEKLCGGLSRVPLGLLRAVAPQDVARTVRYTAETCHGEMASLTEKLCLLEALTAAGRMPFSSDALAAFLEPYRAAGCPSLHHSEAFRAAYAPAYRVMDSRFVRLLPVLAAVREKLRETGRCVLAIDGRCASGKTTAAALLSYVYRAPVVHLDDFFLPPTLRTPERYAEPGGNVDYDRFRREVLPGLAAGSPFTYRRFDCGHSDFAPEPLAVPAAAVRIAEGTYSLHPGFGDYAAVAVFSDITPDEQTRRIRVRDGAYAQVFRERWIPLEEAYFAACRTRERCTVVLPAVENGCAGEQR